MSDKQLALESIQRLPVDVSLDAIAERLEFLAGIRKGLDQVERGETETIKLDSVHSRRFADALLNPVPVAPTRLKKAAAAYWQRVAA